MLKTIAGRMQMGISKSASARLYGWMRQRAPMASTPSQTQPRNMKAREPCYGLTPFPVDPFPLYG
jgi:hypothetical protein